MGKGGALKRLVKNRNKMKTIYRRTPSIENKQNLDLAYRALYTKYNELKDAYFADLIAQMGTTKRNFYNYVKNKKQTQSVLPELMYRGNQRLVGDQRYRAFNEIFQSAYIIDDIPLPNDMH